MDNRLLSILALTAMQTFLSWILRAARLIGSPVNHRPKSCLVGRETAIGYISRQIALAVGKYGRCHRQVDPQCKWRGTVDMLRSNRPTGDSCIMQKV